MILGPSTDPRLLPALAASHALPQAGVDALWRQRVPRVIPKWPLPVAPSSDVVDELLSDPTLLRASTDFAVALASVIRNSAQLNRLLNACKAEEVKCAAQANPYLDAKRRASMPFSSIIVAGTDADAEVTRRILSGDITSIVAAFADPNLSEAAEDRLVDLSNVVKTSGNVKLASVIESAFPAADAASIEAAVQNDDPAGQPWLIRHLRGAILAELAVQNPVAFVSVGAKLARAGRLVDPYQVAAIDAAFQAGLLDPGIKVSLSGYSAAAAELHCSEDSPLRATAEVPTVNHRRTIADTAYSDEDPYLAALAALGLGDAAARLAISAGNLSDDEFVNRLPDADVETIVDWAEKRLGHQPQPGQVAEVLDGLSGDRQKEVLAEVQRRPNPVQMQPELALCLPEASQLTLDERGAVYVAVTASRAFGDSDAAWTLAMQMLVQGWSQTLLELIRSVEALAVS